MEGTTTKEKLYYYRRSFTQQQQQWFKIHSHAFVKFQGGRGSGETSTGNGQTGLPCMVTVEGCGSAWCLGMSPVEVGDCQYAGM